MLFSKPFSHGYLWLTEYTPFRKFNTLWICCTHVSAITHLRMFLLSHLLWDYRIELVVVPPPYVFCLHFQLWYSLRYFRLCDWLSWWCLGLWYGLTICPPVYRFTFYPVYHCYLNSVTQLLFWILKQSVIISSSNPVRKGSVPYWGSNDNNSNGVSLYNFHLC